MFSLVWFTSSNGLRHHPSSPGAPTLELDGKDLVVVEGEKLHLNIPYTAIPTPTMVWQKDKVECKADDKTSMTVEMSNAHLEKLRCSHGDAGEYTITLQNSLGTVSGTVNVKVIGRPLPQYPQPTAQIYCNSVEVISRPLPQYLQPTADDLLSV